MVSACPVATRSPDFVRKADDGLGVSDVHPLGVGPAGIEGDAEGKIEIRMAKVDIVLRLAIRAYSAQHDDLVAMRVGEKDDRRWVRCASGGAP